MKKSIQKLVNQEFMEMGSSLSEQKIRAKLNEIRNMLIERLPDYRGVLKISSEGWVLMCKEFDLLCRQGHWVIHFAFNANTTIVGVIMKEVLKVINVEIGENFYYSHIKKDTYHGYAECREKFLDDIKLLWRQVVVSQSKEDHTLKN